MSKNPKKTPSKTRNTLREGDALQALAARQRPLTQVEREAFRSLLTDEQCDALGGKTKAVNVLREALDWSVVIDGALRDHRDDLDYGPARFSFFLETQRALSAQVRSDGAGGDAAVVEHARTDAMTLRGRITEKLNQISGGDDKDALAAARGTAETTESLVQGLHSLSTLVAKWVRRSDPAGKALVASVGLTAHEAEALADVAKRLQASARDTTLAGKARHGDSALTNRLEGRVLGEMRVAMKAFESAHGRNKVVPRLVPGPGTRAALAHPRGGSDAPVDAPKQAPTAPAS